MDVAAFKARLDAARAFDHVAGEITFRLRLPTEHAWRLALESHRDPHGRLLEAKALRGVLDEAVVGWEGVTGAVFGEGDAAIAFSAEARALLLDHRQDLADELAVALGLRLAERRAAREAAAKN